MDITGKVLREVEFRDRLRGYDTDEVDEFLEQVAVAIDDLHRRLAQAESRPESAPAPIPETQAAEPVITFDDDSIRRTLVLAQRTADLAIKEAKEEADRTVNEARRTAEDLVSQANATVTRLRAEADEEFSNRVSSQLAQREQLERDVRTLSSLVLEERERATNDRDYDHHGHDDEPRSTISHAHPPLASLQVRLDDAGREAWHAGEPSARYPSVRGSGSSNRYDSLSSSLKPGSDFLPTTKNWQVPETSLAAARATGADHAGYFR